MGGAMESTGEGAKYGLTSRGERQEATQDKLTDEGFGQFTPKAAVRADMHSGHFSRDRI